jgi:DNA/RNA endonuclease YhcR with UshA esterase domain
MQTATTTQDPAIAADHFAPPGTVLEIRDETWLVQRAERTNDGWFVEVRGLSELVRGTQATFSSAIDDIKPLDPAQGRSRSIRAPITSSPGSGWRRRSARAPSR